MVTSEKGIQVATLVSSWLANDDQVCCDYTDNCYIMSENDSVAINTLLILRRCGVPDYVSVRQSRIDERWRRCREKTSSARPHD